MGILDGIFSSERGKEVVDGLLHAAETVGNAAYNTAASAINATVNTVTQPGATVQQMQDFIAHPVGTLNAVLHEGSADPNAPRAHQVVMARALLKKINAENLRDAEGKPTLPEYLSLLLDVREQVESEASSQGRRKDIQQEWERSHAAWEKQEGDKGEAPKQPLVVKLSIGGSGDAAWRTHCDIQGVMSDAELKETRKEAGKAKTVYYTGSREYNWNFAGPGGPAQAACCQVCPILDRTASKISWRMLRVLSRTQSATPSRTKSGPSSS